MKDETSNSENLAEERPPTIEEIQRVARHWHNVEALMCKHDTLTFGQDMMPYCSECERPIRFLSDIQIEEMKKHAVPADNHQ